MTPLLNDKWLKWKSEFGSRNNDVIFNTLSMRFPRDIQSYLYRNQMEIKIKSSTERFGYVDREVVVSMVTNNIWSTEEELGENKFT